MAGPDKSISDDFTIKGGPRNVMIGQRIGPDGRYLIRDSLGKGGMGEVFLAFDDVSQTDVAIKLIPREVSLSDIEMEQLRKNFALVHNLHHPNIAAVTQLERLPTGEYFLVMEAVLGRNTLHRERLSRPEEKIPVPEAITICAQLASAIDYAHGMHVIHRDIKPGNVMLTKEGQVKLTDFGLAAQIVSSMNRVSMMPVNTSGTRPYMAPEQWEGRLQDGRTDQWAMAVVFYELVTGRLPFPAEDPVILERQALHHTPERATELNDGQWQVLLKALSKNKESRYDSCMEFVDAVSSGTPQRHLSRALKIAALVVVVLAAIGGAGLGTYVYVGRSLANRRQAQQLVQQADAMTEGGNWTEALPVYRRAHELNPSPLVASRLDACQRQVALDNADTELAEARSLIAAGNLDEALRKADEVLAAVPDHEAAKTLAEDLRNRRENAAAAADAIAEGRRQLQAGHMDKATERLREAQRLAPGHPGLAELAEAIAVADTVRTLIDEIRLLTEQGRYEDARSRCAELRRLDPENTTLPVLAAGIDVAHLEVLTQTAEEMIQAGRVEDASNALEQARTIRPNDPRVTNLQRRLDEYRSRRMEEDTLAREADRLARDDKLEEALAAYEKAEQIDPAAAAFAPQIAALKQRLRVRQQVDEFVRQARVHEAGDDFLKARAALKQALDVDPHSARAQAASRDLEARIVLHVRGLIQEASALRGHNNLADAERKYREALALDGNNAAAVSGLAALNATSTGVHPPTVPTLSEDARARETWRHRFQQAEQQRSSQTPPPAPPPPQPGSSLQRQRMRELFREGMQDRN